MSEKSKTKPILNSFQTRWSRHLGYRLKIHAQFGGTVFKRTLFR